MKPPMKRAVAISNQTKLAGGVANARPLALPKAN